MLDWTVPLVAFLLAGSRAHYRCDDGSECECGVAGPGADTAGNSTEFPLAEDGGGEIDNSTEAGEFPLGESEKLSGRGRGGSRCGRESCQCADGSVPTSTRARLVCSDGGRADCSGACPDGSDPARAGLLRLLTRSPPCPASTWPVIARCRCGDGGPATVQQVPTRSGLRGLLTRIRDLFG